MILIEIRSAGSDTLTSSSSCGIWQAGGNGPITDLEKQIIANNRLNTTLSAAIYASSCYTSSPDPLRCSVYTLPSLPSTIDSNASCPFASGMCYFSDTAAYKMDTGKLDSNYHLGMNFPPGERITFQRTTTCAPIHIENYTVIQQVAGVNGTTTPLANVYLGPILDTLETYSYNNDSSNYVDGYTLG